MQKTMESMQDIFFLIFCLTAGLFMCWIIIKISQKPFIADERNMKARSLCRKINTGENLVPKEKETFDKFISDGIIDRDDEGYCTLSEKALDEFFGVMLKNKQ